MGTCLLILGAEYHQVPDWDVGVSLVMASLTYLTAPYCIKTALCSNHLGKLLFVIFLAWFTVDGSYTLYWSIVNPDALVLRDVQWPISTILYLFCGIVWYFSKEGKNPLQ